MARGIDFIRCIIPAWSLLSRRSQTNPLHITHHIDVVSYLDAPDYSLVSKAFGIGDFPDMNNDPQKSTTFCGCDEGANYQCERHRGLTGLYIPPAKTEPMQPAPPADSSVIKKNRPTLPTNPTERKTYPLATGLLDYFPDALAAIAHLSWIGNEQHNPGEPLHWAREKSADQEDTIMRHFVERGGIDTDGERHSTKFAWRALAMLQLELENV